ncbi:DUF551 domain-containing protein [Escherichia coli]|uniref:DUF551 domain-containing protein n=1 Tax=Escherichia coli TaxID=562 RepID=UPI00193BD420|nr:DUF551 domain-containing protein [Escherichia coli]MBM2963414.1 DUF551 domain-containing protein [Escherichia coli]MBM3032060.1 DUF551 domain-containing protein [Escherichia coli]
MTTITKERLLTIKQWRETYGPGSNVVLPAEEAEELARIALASLEAEPVAWMRDDADGREYNARNEFSGGGGGVPLYATPPVPVVPEEKPMPNPLSMYAVDAVAAIAEVRGWNACRAAMLQGSQPVSQTYKFPVNTPCQDAPAHIWLQTAGVWPEDGELSELTWCSHNQHHDDTLYVRADLVNGNSPVTPDGWISCSERMPAQDDWILIYSKHGEYMAGQVQGEYVELSDGTLSWLGNALYWMPLPEPPQEVNRG